MKKHSSLLVVSSLMMANMSAHDMDMSALQQRGLQRTKKIGPSHVIDKVTKGVITLSADQKGMVVNSIAAIIHVEPMPIVITWRDVEMPSINGQKRTLDEIIFERLLAYEAEHVYHLGNSEDSARKYFETIKKQNNLSDDEFKAIFTRLGKTPEEAFQEFKISYVAEQIVSFKVRNRVNVSEEEVRAYYEQNPEYEEAAYKIKRGIIPKGSMTETELQEFQDEQKHSYKVEWSDPYWLKDSEIAESSNFIKKMEPGSYSALEVTSNGYEVVKLVQKRLKHKKTFDECRLMIIEKLQIPSFKNKMDELKKELFDKYQISYFQKQ